MRRKIAILALACILTMPIAALQYQNDERSYDTSIVDPTLLITSPNGGEEWTALSDQYINWTKVGSIGNVKLEYSTDGFVSDANTIVASTPNDGSHLWTVANDPSSSVTVRVSFVDESDINDVSNASFTITSAGSDPFSWWKLDEMTGSTADDALSTNDGTLHNMGNEDWVSAILNNGLAFDGDDDYVVVPDASGLDLTNALTLSAWVRTTGLGSAYWQYRKALTIDSTKVDATLTDFPVLVSITDTDLKDSDNGGPVQPDGDDLRFTLTDSTQLSHEIELYNGTTGNLVAWVKVPSLSGSADTTLFLEYGNPTVASQQSPTSVWDSSFEGVYHLNGTAADSTSNDNDGTFPGGDSGTIDVRVTTANDDAEERTSGTMYLDSSDLELIDDSDYVGEQEVGMRFLNVAVPQGATISNAYLEFETDETDSVSTTLNFYAEDIDDAPAFSTSSFDITDRTKTSASVTWSNVPAWDTLDEKHQTPDLSAIIQEVVDRSGWSSGNDMVIIVDGSGERTAEAYDGESANAPLLHFEYSVGGGATAATGIAANGNDFAGTAADTITIPDDTTLDISDTLTIEGWVSGAGQDVAATGGGTIADTVVDTLEFDTVNGETPDIIHISGNVYAIAYEGDGDDGWLKTFTISDSGTITDTPIDSLEFDTTQGKSPTLLHISGNVFALAYKGTDDDGFLKTVEIATNGQITNTVIDTLEFDTAKGDQPDIIHISGNVYAIAYKGDGDDGFLKTIEIASNGAITDTVIDTLEFDDAEGHHPSIVHISGDVYAIAYKGDPDDGYLKTVEIASNGAITDAVIDTLEYDTAKGDQPEMIAISEDVFAIAYKGDGDDGFLKTIEIASNGAITDTVIDTLEFDTDKGDQPDIIHVSGDVYALAYKDIDADGWLKTVDIDTPAATQAGLAVKSGAYELRANATDAHAYINTDTVDDTLGSGWQHLALTYDQNGGANNQKLYVDGVLAAQATTTGAITTNANALLIGQHYDATLDEVRVSSTVRSAAWLKTTFNNLDGPSTFLTVGDQSVTTIAKAGAYGLGLTTTTALATVNDQTLSASVSGGVWHHLVLTYDRTAGGTDELKLYVDGTQADTADHSTAISTNGEDLLFGQGFAGGMDEIRLYNFQLSAAQVTSLYESYLTIVLTLPNGGESWQRWTDQYINWSSAGPYDTVKLEYSTDNFVSDINTIVASTPDDGSYIWSLPNLNSDTVRVRASFVDDADTNDVSDADFSILVPSLTLTDPDGGESWLRGTSQDITWTSEDSLGSIKLEYSTDNFDTDVNTIVASTDDDGTYEWTVPTVASSTVRVRVSFVDNASVADTSDADFTILVPTLTLTDPNGGESWVEGTSHDITWSSSDSLGNVKLEYSTDDFDTDVNTISASTSDDGTHPWTIPSLSSSTVRVRVSYVDDVTVNDVSDADLTLLTPSLTLTDPDGGESWIAGSSHDITWTSDDSPGNVKLEYSTDNFDTDINTIVASTADDGTYEWTVPSDRSSTVRVRVSFVDHSTFNDVSDADFTIEVPELTLTDPDGGESWSVDTGHAITWTSQDSLGNVKLEYSTDNFVSDINTIVASTADDGSHYWTIPSDRSSTVRVRVSFVADSSVNDVSDADFTILVPSLTLTSPDGGESWVESTSHDITWTSLDPLGNVKLEYSTDNFVADINTIIASTADDGSHTWNTPSLSSSTVRVRVSFVDNASVLDVSDGDFSLLTPSITLTDPDGGESWYGGSSHDITWTSGDSPGNVKLEYSTDNFVADINTIVASTADDGTYSWSVASISSDTVRVRVCFADHASYNDVSDGDFEIISIAAWWKFDEESGTNAEDSAGDNDGTLNNMGNEDWVTGKLNNGLDFDGTNDYVSVSDHADLDLTDTITLAAWIKTDSGLSLGEIANSVIDTKEYETTNGEFPSMVHVSGDVYAIAYQGDGDDGYVKTISIDPDGDIGASVIDTLEFDTVKGKSPRIIHVSGDIFAISYWGDGDDGWLVTVEIASNGQITNSVVDSLEYDTVKGKISDLIHVSGDVYAIAYWGDGDDGWLKTVEIASNGQITNSVIDSYEFDNDECKFPRILHVSGNVFAIAYPGKDSDGWVKTVEIATDGEITNSAIDSYEYETGELLSLDFIAVGGDYYAIVYQDKEDDGILKTIEIATNGQITNSVVDSLEFESDVAMMPDISLVGGETYAIAYQGPGDDGFLVTVDIDDSGQIAASVTDTLEFDTSDGYSFSLVHVSGDTFAIAYQGSGDDGYLKTVSITSGRINIVSKGAAYAMGASSDTVFVTVNDQTLSADITAGVWTHVVMTYNTTAGGTTEFKLYLDGTQVASADYSTAMTANTDDLLIGNMFDGVLDEMRIYDIELSGTEVSDLYDSYS